MSTWETRELPVLRAIAAHFTVPDATPVDLATLAARVRLPEAEIREALVLLTQSRPPYVQGVQQGNDAPLQVTGLTGRALDELGHLDAVSDPSRTRPRGPRPPGAPAG